MTENTKKKPETLDWQTLQPLPGVWRFSEYRARELLKGFGDRDIMRRILFIETNYGLFWKHSRNYKGEIEAGKRYGVKQ